MEKYDVNTRTLNSVSSIFMSHVYQWMTLGLLVTAVSAFVVANNATLTGLFYGSFVPTILLAVVVVALPLVLSGMITKMSATTATTVFVVYSALMGAFLSSVFVVYTTASITKTFLITAGTFAAMSFYGTVTKRDLTQMGSFLFMGMIGLIIAMLVNLFLQSGALDFVISCIGVIIFTGLTAYDTQKLREFGAAAPLDDLVAVRRGALLGALSLYLDFVNMFLMLLRFFGDQR